MRACDDDGGGDFRFRLSEMGMLHLLGPAREQYGGGKMSAWERNGERARLSSREVGRERERWDER